MSVRVNLLPRAAKASAKSGRQRLITLVLVLVFLLGLTAASLWQRGQLSTANDELAVAEDELALARADVAGLQQYADLERQVDSSRALVAEALGDQVTVAGILQDLAMLMPADIDIGSLSISLPQQTEPDLPPDAPVGTLNFSGESTESIAPGIERLLIQIERIAGYRDPHVSTATVDDEDVVSYNLDVELGPELLTRRFIDGVRGDQP